MTTYEPSWANCPPTFVPIPAIEQPKLGEEVVLRYYTDDEFQARVDKVIAAMERMSPNGTLADDELALVSFVSGATIFMMEEANNGS